VPVAEPGPVGRLPEWRGVPPRAVLFDLDGTLIDTLGDIRLSLNRALAERGIGALELEVVRALIGRGAPALIERALEHAGHLADSDLRRALLERFLALYAAIQANGESSAVAYPDAAITLARLEAAGLKLAVVTNKSRALAIAALELAGLSSVGLVVGGDTCGRRKPHPEPLVHACAVLGVATGHALMVGDSANDVAAARGAGMPVFCVPYGYNEGQDPRLLPCDGILERLADLPELLGLALAPRDLPRASG